MTTVLTFKDDDASYLAWLRGNPKGYVVNCYRRPTAKYLILHTANCWTVTGTPVRGDTWTNAGYIKVCSTDRHELELWAQNEVGGRLKPCSHCFR